jgi:hypothetical protein
MRVASFRFLHDRAPSVIEIEDPHRCSASRGAHEPGSLQQRGHASRGVNKSPKRIAFHLVLAPERTASPNALCVPGRNVQFSQATPKKV